VLITSCHVSEIQTLDRKPPTRRRRCSKLWKQQRVQRHGKLSLRFGWTTCL